MNIGPCECLFQKNCTVQCCTMYIHTTCRILYSIHCIQVLRHGRLTLLRLLYYWESMLEALAAIHARQLNLLLIFCDVN